MVAPRRIDAVDLHLPGGDLPLARAHPGGITVHWDPHLDEYHALAPDGTRLLHVTGFQAAPAGATAHRPRSTPADTT